MKYILLIIICLFVACTSKTQQKTIKTKGELIDSIIVIRKINEQVKNVLVVEKVNDTDSLYSELKKEKKNEIKDYYIDRIIIDQPVSLYLTNKKIDSIVLAFCNGDIYPSDNEITFNLLETLTRKCDTLAPLYYDCFKYLCSHSDGSLGEIMGMFAKDFILNNPSFSIDNFSGSCMDQLALEFAINEAWKHDIKEFSDSLKINTVGLIDTTQIDNFIAEIRKATIEMEKDIR